MSRLIWTWQIHVWEVKGKPSNINKPSNTHNIKVFFTVLHKIAYTVAKQLIQIAKKQLVRSFGGKHGHNDEFLIVIMLLQESFAFL